MRDKKNTLYVLFEKLSKTKNEAVNIFKAEIVAILLLFSPSKLTKLIHFYKLNLLFRCFRIQKYQKLSFLKIV